ncbi:MAG: 3-hydroxybenzoate 6-monooxygenase, partial [Alcaligenaceae bacterium]
AFEFQPIGYGIQLGPNAFHMFDRLGVASRVLRSCTFPNAGIMRDIVTGDEITRLPMGDALKHRYGQPYAVIHRGDLHNALLEACKGLPNIKMLTASRVESYEQTGKVVSVTCADGTVHTGCVLIGADGVWSKVRDQMGAGIAQPQSLGYVAYRGLRKRSEIPPALFEQNVNLWSGPGYHMMHYPVRSDELFNIVAVFRSRRFASGRKDHSGPDELLEIFKDACPHVRDLLDLVDTEKHWDISVMEPVSSWCNGRVALLGDAAHAMLQAMAQGACQAIEDAVWLAEYLSASRDDIPAALRRYQQHRQLRAVRMQYQSRFYWEVYHAGGVYAELRKQLLARSPEEAMESLAWVYDRQQFPEKEIAKGVERENLPV